MKVATPRAGLCSGVHPARLNCSNLRASRSRSGARLSGRQEVAGADPARLTISCRDDIRRLAWLAEKQDYRWDLLVSLVRSVLDNVSTVEMEHPDPLSNFL